MKIKFNTDANLTKLNEMLWDGRYPHKIWGEAEFASALEYLQSFGLPMNERKEKIIQRPDAGPINDFDGKGALGFYGDPKSEHSFPLCYSYDPARPADDQTAIDFAYTRLLSARRYYATRAK